MLPFLLVASVAALVTAAVTPLVARLARRAGAVDRPDERKVHARPVPTMGGLAMLAGFVAAFAVAAFHPAFDELFTSSSEPVGVLAGVVVIAVVGVVDDVRGLRPEVKLAGQIVAALLPALLGVQLVYAWIPGLEVVTISSDLGLPLTLLFMVAMINAVNLIDGLDGLAAGVVAIAAAGFFAFTAFIGGGVAESLPSSAPLVAAVLVGLCLGFLVHNRHPATVIMGDTGAMVLGLLLSSAGVAYVGRTTAPSYVELAGSVPLLVPVLMLAIPFLDTAFAIVRRAMRGTGIGVADRGHLHHLLLSFGHSHRRAVVVLWYWSAVLAGAALAWALVSTTTLVAGTTAAVLGGVLLTWWGAASRPLESASSEDADERDLRVG